MRVKEYLTESSLSRIWLHIEKKTNFAVISASRGDYSDKENNDRYRQLKNIIREKGYGFIEMRGGYKEDGGFVYEKSLFIPNISKTEAIEIGSKFNQESILYKDNTGFYMIDTRDNIGKILTKFVSGGRKSLDLAKESIKDFFSSLVKGSHKDRKFLFSIEERELNSFNKTAYLKNEPKWFQII